MPAARPIGQSIPASDRVTWPTNDNCRDLSRRSGYVPGTSVLAEKTHPRDPANRPDSPAQN